MSRPKSLSAAALPRCRAAGLQRLAPSRRPVPRRTDARPRLATTAVCHERPTPKSR